LLEKITLDFFDYYREYYSWMKDYSSQQAARKLGIAAPTLTKYINTGKIPAPRSITAGGITVHLWTEAEIEHVRQLLPKIANGRKTRYSKLREKQKAQPKKAVPRKQKKK
jgi:predicted DNA-binding transcriptional regulator AlpA